MPDPFENTPWHIQRPKPSERYVCDSKGQLVAACETDEHMEAIRALPKLVEACTHLADIIEGQGTFGSWEHDCLMAAREVLATITALETEEA